MVKMVKLVILVKFGSEVRSFMINVNVLEAKTEFSKLIRLVETGREDCIIVSRYGKPVVKMVVYNDQPVSKRIGIAEGKFKIPDDFDMDNDVIEEMFGGEQ